MAIPDAYKHNFHQLLKAAEHHHLALMECKEKKTGKLVYTLCAVQTDGGESYQFVPVAKLFDGDPYEELEPPDPRGGFSDG